MYFKLKKNNIYGKLLIFKLWKQFWLMIIKYTDYRAAVLLCRVNNLWVITKRNFG